MNTIDVNAKQGKWRTLIALLPHQLFVLNQGFNRAERGAKRGDSGINADRSAAGWAHHGT